MYGECSNHGNIVRVRYYGIKLLMKIKAQLLWQTCYNSDQSVPNHTLFPSFSIGAIIIHLYSYQLFLRGLTLHRKIVCNNIKCYTVTIYGFEPTHPTQRHLAQFIFAVLEIRFIILSLQLPGRDIVI